MLSLIIVESPSKCCTLEQHLPSNYTSIACCGHFMEIAGLGAIHPKTYQPTFTPIAKRNAVITQLLAAAADADDIILATDDDREGEAIAWHLCILLKLPVATTKRMRFHDMTAASLQKALLCCDTLQMPVVEAQQARQVLDMLIGFKISPILWHHFKQEHLSAGRCQTPALRLVYDQHQQHLTFKKETKQQFQYKVTGYFTSLNLPFTLPLNDDDNDKVQEFLNASKTHSHVLQKLEFKTVIKPAPLPFNTSTLLQTAKTQPSETMTLCQTLYEKGYITYMRTDSQAFSAEGQSSLNRFLLKDSSHVEIPVVAAAAADAAHEAIRPTQLHLKTVHGTKKEQDLYTLIRNRTLESGLPQAVLNEWCASITAPLGQVYHYHCTAVVSAGWLQIQSLQEKNEHSFFLQNIPLETLLPYKKITAKLELLGGQPQHLTEAALIQQLEKHNIGRPSTYASLLQKIQDRHYVKRQNVKGVEITTTEYALEKTNLQEEQVQRTFGAEKNKLVMTPLGLQTMAFLVQHFDPLFNYNSTQEMEEQLDGIVLAKTDFKSVCERCATTVEALIQALGSRGKETIYIDAQHTYVTGKYGPVIKKIDEETKTASFLALSKVVDLAKLRHGEDVVLKDIALPVGTKEQKCLGHTEQGEEVWLKAGKFGRYLEVGKEKVRLALKGHASNKTLLYNVMLADIQDRLVQVVDEYRRVITPDASLRSGPHGDYIYYKTKTMKKPKFLPLTCDSGCPAQPRDCDLNLLQTWFHERYKV